MIRGVRSRSGQWGCNRSPPATEPRPLKLLRVRPPTRSCRLLIGRAESVRTARGIKRGGVCVTRALACGCRIALECREKGRSTGRDECPENLERPARRYQPRFNPMVDATCTPFGACDPCHSPRKNKVLRAQGEPRDQLGVRSRLWAVPAPRSMHLSLWRTATLKFKGTLRPRGTSFLDCTTRKPS